VIRYGGEEFLVVLPQTDLAGACALAERIRLAFAGTASRTPSGATVSATASFGIAAVPVLAVDLPASAEALIGAADAELYAAKHAGRNTVRGMLVGTAA
jgi:diguanylate cyclase (GGDEF)-like protein